LKLTLVQGDCLKYLPKIPDESIDLVVTSPPYNLGIDYGICKDKLPWDEYYSWCESWLREIYRILKRDGRLCLNHYFSCGDSSFRTAPLMELYNVTKRIGFKHHSLAIWWDQTLCKLTAWGSWCNARAPYINAPLEGILIMYKKIWRKLNSGKSTINKKSFIMGTTGIWKIQPETHNLTKSCFPIELPKLCIELLSYENDLVLDPFLGSGTTMLACLQTNRNCIGIEIEPKYVEICKKRLNWGSTLGDVEFKYEVVS